MADIQHFSSKFVKSICKPGFIKVVSKAPACCLLEPRSIPACPGTIKTSEPLWKFLNLPHQEGETGLDWRFSFASSSWYRTMLPISPFYPEFSLSNLTRDILYPQSCSPCQQHRDGAGCCRREELGSHEGRFRAMEDKISPEATEFGHPLGQGADPAPGI